MPRCKPLRRQAGSVLPVNLALGASMQLHELILESYPEGLCYEEMAQLCLYLYSVDCGLPDDLAAQCTRDNLPSVFANLVAAGCMIGEADTAACYGASSHRASEIVHWA